MAAMVDMVCWCGKQYQACKADVKRGWGKACCKAHAAHAREKKLDRFGFQRGESGTFHSRMDELRSRGGDDIDWEGGGWDAHKDSF